MNLSDWSRDPAGQLKWIAGLGRECIKDASRFDECTTFWGVIGGVLGIVGLIVLFAVVRHFLRERAEFRRAWERKQAELEVAPPEVMAEHKWNGDKALGADLSHDEMVRRIKEAKAQRRFEAATSPPSPSGDPKLGIDPLHK